MDHAYAQNLAKPPLMRICREFENRCVLRALSGKFLQQKSCYPESFLFSDSVRNNIDINIDNILISIISILIYIMLSNMWRVCFRIFEVNIGKRGLTEND